MMDNAGNRMWKCPKCGRTFKNENQSHYCGKSPETVDEYILAQDADIREQLQRVREAPGGAVTTSSILRRKKNTSVFIRDLRLLLFSLRSWMHTGSNTAKGLSRYHTLMTCLCPSFLRLLPGAGTRGITHD